MTTHELAIKLQNLPDSPIGIPMVDSDYLLNPKIIRETLWDDEQSTEVLGYLIIGDISHSTRYAISEEKNL